MTLNQITKVKGPGIHTLANIISNSVSLGGIATASNFKTGTSNLHSAGVEVAGINVLGADTPIGTGATIYNSGAAVFTGVVTATSFSGSIDGTASLASGLTGTPDVAVRNITGVGAKRLSSEGYFSRWLVANKAEKEAILKSIEDEGMGLCFVS